MSRETRATGVSEHEANHPERGAVTEGSRERSAPDADPETDTRRADDRRQLDFLNARISYDMSLSVTVQKRSQRREHLYETAVAVGTLLVAVLGAVVLTVLVGAALIAVGEPLPMLVRLGLVFVAVAVGAFLTSVLVDSPFTDTFGKWYEGR